MFSASKGGIKISTPIPIEPLHISGADVSACGLYSLYHGRCVCWEPLSLVSSLQFNYTELEERICPYHREDIVAKREHRLRAPPVSLHSPSWGDVLFQVRVLPPLVTDLTTTSTQNFHRCSCPVWLKRCCRLFGASAAYTQQAHTSWQRHEVQRHLVERTKQNNRCSLGSLP